MADIQGVNASHKRVGYRWARNTNHGVKRLRFDLLCVFIPTEAFNHSSYTLIPQLNVPLYHIRQGVTHVLVQRVQELIQC